MPFSRSVTAFLMGLFIAHVVQLHKDKIFQIFFEKESYDLVIGVLSARDHFEQRQVIRDTWMTKNSSKYRISSMFVVGTNYCDIHPDNRISEYSCKRWNVSMKDTSEDIHVMSAEVNTSRDYISTSKFYQNFIYTLHFKVMHPVVIKRLGLLEDILLKKEPVIITLFNESLQEEIVKTSFNLLDPGIIDVGHYRYQPISYVTLPKIF